MQTDSNAAVYKRLSLLIGLPLLMMAAAVLLWPRPPATVTANQADAPPSINLANKQSDQPRPDNPDVSYQVLSTPSVHDQLVVASSLAGTDIDGAIKADRNGALILDQGVRDFFDYFLSASDQIGAESAIAEIQRYINTYLPASAGAEAHQLLANYLRYKKYEIELQQQPLSNANIDNADALQLLRQNFEQLALKRSELFSDGENQALFGLEQSYQAFTLSSLELFADESLTDTQKQQQLTGLQQQLPPELQASQRDTAKQHQQQKELQALAQNKHDDSDYHQALIDQGLSQEKSSELLAYRQSQQHFDDVYQQYQARLSTLDPQSKDYPRRQLELQRSFFKTPSQLTKAKLRDLQQP